MDPVARHYQVGTIGERILDALEKSGKDRDRLTPLDLAPVDEFHIRGREATEELARVAELDASTRVLDVGCGTGYLSRKLEDRGASVTGIDLSEEMVRIARSKHPDITFRVDSCSELASLESDAFDLAVANYVLMDTPDLEGTMQALSRVLKRGGRAVLVFSHPCFPQGRADVSTSTDDERT